MATKYCFGLGLVLLALGLFGSITGGHDHQIWLFGSNFYSNVLRLALGFIAFAAHAAGPRHARMFCLESAAVFGALAAAGQFGFAPVVQTLQMTVVDVYFWGAAALASLTLGIASSEPLRLRTAVERDGPLSLA